jgi:hypothetical protein
MDMMIDRAKVTAPIRLASSVAGRNALGSLQKLLAGLFDVSAPEADATPDRISFDVRGSSKFLVSDIGAPSIRLLRPTQAGAHGSLDAFGFRLQMSGDARGLVGDQAFEIRLGDLLVFNLQQNLDLTISAGPEGARDFCLGRRAEKCLRPSAATTCCTD